MRSGKTSLIVAISIALLAGLARPARAQDAAALDAAWQALPTYKLGESRQALDAIQRAVVAAQTDPAKRAALAAKLASFLSAEATYEAKDFCCRQLYIIATKAEIPAVAKLLPDEKLSHMARYVLEAMGDPDADAAMRDALGKVQGKLLIGVVNSLGNRRDVKATAAFIQMLGGNDPALAASAAAALGKIGGADAIKALAAQKNNASAEVKNAVLDAYLLCADNLLKAGQNDDAAAIYNELLVSSEPMRIRTAALRGLVVAQPAKAMPLVLENLKSNDAASVALACGFARQIEGEAMTRAFAAALPTLEPAAQALLIEALASRGDAAAKPAILAAVKSEDVAVRAAAVRAIASLGDATDVAALVAMASKAGTERDAARASLNRLKGNGVDAAIVVILQSGSPDARVECAKSLAARRATSATPALLNAAQKDQTESVRCAAIEALGALTADKDFQTLIDLLLAANSQAELNAADNAIANASQRMKNRDDSIAPILAAMEKALVPAKKVLLNDLAKMGGDKPLAAVRAATKDGNAEIQEAATRCLLAWPDTAAIPDMLSIARSGDAKFKTLALRGLVQVMERNQNRANLDTYKQMLSIASTPAEKKLVIAGLGNTRGPGALDLLTPLLADNDVRAEAATSIIKLARSARGAAATAALQKVVDANISDDITNRAKAAMQR